MQKGRKVTARRSARFATAIVFAIVLAVGLISTGLAAATIEIRPSTVSPGGKITAEGSGYAANATITVAASAAGVTLSLGTTRSDAAGKFSLEVTLPAIVPLGTFQVSATDTAGNTASASVTVAAASAAPSAALPRTGEPITMLAMGIAGAAGLAAGLWLRRRR